MFHTRAASELVAHATMCPSGLNVSVSVMPRMTVESVWSVRSFCPVTISKTASEPSVVMLSVSSSLPSGLSAVSGPSLPTDAGNFLMSLPLVTSHTRRSLMISPLAALLMALASKRRVSSVVPSPLIATADSDGSVGTLRTVAPVLMSTMRVPRSTMLAPRRRLLMSFVAQTQ